MDACDCPRPSIGNPLGRAALCNLARHLSSLALCRGIAGTGIQDSKQQHGMLLSGLSGILDPCLDHNNVLKVENSGQPFTASDAFRGNWAS